MILPSINSQSSLSGILDSSSPVISRSDDCTSRAGVSEIIPIPPHHSLHPLHPLTKILPQSVHKVLRGKRLARRCLDVRGPLFARAGAEESFDEPLPGGFAPDDAARVLPQAVLQLRGDEMADLVVLIIHRVQRDVNLGGPVRGAPSATLRGSSTATLRAREALILLDE